MVGRSGAEGATRWCGLRAVVGGLLFVPVLLGAAPLGAQGPDAGSAEATPARLRVEGDRIVFDGDIPRADDTSISAADVEEFRDLARANPHIRRIELNSEGGFLADGLAFAHVVQELGFDTHVAQHCLSACTDVFLGGRSRVLEPGARLGFHAASWSRTAIAPFYAEAREEYGWMDEMAFASWVYEEAMRDQLKSIAFMASRGVRLEFILRAHSVVSDDFWYPTRQELTEAGVLVQQD